MHLSIFNSRPIKWTIIFMVLMVTAAGTFKAWSLNQSNPALRPLSTQFWIHKVHTSERFDMIFVGDSRIYRGIAPSEIQKKMPALSVFNFGFSSGGLNATLLDAAERKLLGSGRKIIILGVSPNALTATSALNEEYKEFKKLPAWPYRVPFLYLLLSPDETVWSLTHFWDKVDRKYYQLPHEDGWVESNQVPENVNSALDQYKKRFAKEKISKQVLKEMLERVSIWKRQGYTVFGFRPPASPAMEELENSASGFDEQAIHAEFQNAGGIWIDIQDRYQYKTYDGSHLNSESAKRLSAFIADYIANSISVPVNNRTNP